MRKIVTAMIVMMISAGTGFAAFSKNDAGTSTAQFLKLGAGADAAGMGEAYAAVANDASSIYWNPAGLNRIEGKSVSVMHAVWFEDISYDWAAYAQKVEGIGTVGIGIQYLSYGDITETDNTGLEGGSFSPNDLAVSLSYARQIKGIDLGANVKYISSKIKKSATAYAADLGAQYRLNERISFGAALQNMGTGMKFDSEEDALPFNIKVGGAYDIRPNWKAALDVNAPIDNEVVFGAGTEYVYRINQTMSAAGRLGYNTRAKDTGGLNGISAGLGFAYQNYRLDYAFVPYGDLGNTHRISFGVNFK